MPSNGQLSAVRSDPLIFSRLAVVVSSAPALLVLMSARATVWEKISNIHQPFDPELHGIYCCTPLPGKVRPRLSPRILPGVCWTPQQQARLTSTTVIASVISDLETHFERQHRKCMAQRDLVYGNITAPCPPFALGTSEQPQDFGATSVQREPLYPYALAEVGHGR